ncbi:MAG: N-6 DNA methylase [Chitinophagales bacterium]
MSLINSNPKIASIINDLWNKFWSGGISNPLTAIEQITYLLFMKKLDENDLLSIADAEFSGDKFTSKFKGTFYLRKEDEQEKRNGVDKQTLRWSEFKRMPSAEMLLHIQQYVFPFIKQLDTDSSPFTKHMANAVFIIPKPSLLLEAVKSIDLIFEEMENDANDNGQNFQDIQGDVYEMLLNEIASAGKNGQFRTPRHIIKLVAELVAPKLGQRIADPACGTGGFLLGAYQYMVTHLNKNLKDVTPDEDGFILQSKSAALTEQVKEILGKSLQGYDIDQTMVRLGLMNLMMHGIESPGIDYKDTLSKSYVETSEYDIVLANPPFTGNIDKGDINEELNLSTTKTELLFIERIYNMLKMGGTAGVVLPQGVLFGSSKAFIAARKLMIEQSELKAVITMPSGVFKPYAGVSTAILIFTKGGETNKVWFYDMEADGYSLDDKRAPLKNKDGSDNYGDLQDIVSTYTNRNPDAKENDKKGKHFFVSKAEIAEENYDLSFSRYKEEVYEEIVYEKPSLILEKLIGKNGDGGLEKEIVVALKELKELF